MSNSPIPWSKIFSSIPHAGHRSYWLQDIAGDAPDQPRLIGEQSSDVGIVGRGIVGLWSAIEVKFRILRVATELTGVDESALAAVTSVNVAGHGGQVPDQRR
jgi:hypothetical protein